MLGNDALPSTWNPRPPVTTVGAAIPPMAPVNCFTEKVRERGQQEDSTKKKATQRLEPYGLEVSTNSDDRSGGNNSGGSSVYYGGDGSSDGDVCARRNSVEEERQDASVSGRHKLS